MSRKVIGIIMFVLGLLPFILFGVLFVVFHGDLSDFTLLILAPLAPFFFCGVIMSGFGVYFFFNKKEDTIEEIKNSK